MTTSVLSLIIAFMAVAMMLVNRINTSRHRHADYSAMDMEHQLRQLDNSFQLFRERERRRAIEHTLVFMFVLCLLLLLCK